MWEGYTFKKNYVKKLIGYAWIRFNRIVEVGRMQRKIPKIDFEIEWDVIEKSIWCRWMRIEVLKC